MHHQVIAYKTGGRDGVVHAARAGEHERFGRAPAGHLAARADHPVRPARRHALCVGPSGAFRGALLSPHQAGPQPITLATQPRVASVDGFGARHAEARPVRISKPAFSSRSESDP
jgi:hypothetical protein